MKDPIDTHINPLLWWKTNEKHFPLLALFMKSNAAFQPTTLASERMFNKDKLLFGQTRKRLGTVRSSGLIFLHDYIIKRVDPAEYKICPTCPKPPTVGANYRITCSKHRT